MIKIFCSTKVSTLIGIKVKSEVNDTISGNWNVHLFLLNRKKCLLFIHKETLFCTAVYGIVKKDYPNLNTLFVNSLVKQLYVQEILTETQEQILRDAYKDVTFFTTDNDRKVIGFLNDCIARLKHHKSDEAGVEFYIKNYMNQNPWATLGFRNSKVEMKKYIIENFLK